MKYLKTTHWTDLPNQQGLLFFAQILNEALFDYTLDTYKTQALNIRLLCIEALQTIDNIKLGLIKKPNIESVIDELLWSLNGDFVAKELVGTKLSGIIEKINSNRNNLKNLKEVIQLLYHYLDDKKYLNHIQIKLNRLVPENKEKGNIYKATKSFVTELVSYGYTTSYIYHNANRFFFNYAESFSQTTPKTFFEIFNYKEKTFTVVYKVSKLFKEFESLSETLNFKIQEKYSTKNLSGDEKKFISNINTSETFIVFENVEAFDDNVARIMTEIPLFKIGNLFSFYHHKEVPKISTLALVTNHSDKFSLLREQPIKSIIKKADTNPKTAALKAKNLFSTLNLPPETIYRISRAIDLHSISLTTEQVENKLINLWTSLETLIPKDIDCGDDRIIQIIKALLPFQTLKYINKLIEQAGNDFSYFDSENSKKLIKATVLKDSENSFHALSALIMTVENETIRTQVYDLLNNYPLLRFRLFTLNKTLSNGKEVVKLIEIHRQKVEWQIRRIYRVRNLIVHSGKMPSYTNILVENLHNYFDDFLNYVIDNAIRDKRIRTINEAILNAEIDVNTLINNIKSIGDNAITLDNYKKIL
ncbi:hypothetical protein [Flavobacterium sp. KJJ]|uniref:hypothetical protein n=1 Tax=Flavobacterium sp. KJJ TaxID=1270193 RepID=UPI000493352E|nr:hypothetical protein [Flavobacterium sp. KJJ]